MALIAACWHRNPTAAAVPAAAGDAGVVEAVYTVGIASGPS